MTVTATELDSSGPLRSHAYDARWVTDLLLFLMALIWGVNFSVLKYATQFISPLAFNGLRIPIAAATQLGLAGAMRLERVSRQVALRLILLGLMGNGLYQCLFILGIVRSRVATAALVFASTPAFVAILGRILGTERLGKRSWVGIGLQIVGCSTVVMGSGRGANGRDSLLGGVLILGAALSWAIYSVLLRTYTARAHPVQVGGYTMLGGAMVTGMVGLPALTHIAWAEVPSGVWLALLYSSLLAMVVAYLFWYRGLRVLGPTRVAVYSNLQPVIAAVVAYLALHEVPTGPQVVGAVFVISGLLLTRHQTA